MSLRKLWIFRPIWQQKGLYRNKDIDHYDAIEGQFDGDVKPVIRTLVTYQEITRDYQGKEISSVQQMRRLQWTLLQRNELSKQSLDWLNINPLGIQIIDDKSVQQ
ncbi:Uncharacterised protein [Escherichia coli]|nr:Uncharacterised protein [Escherichia coli]